MFARVPADVREAAGGMEGEREWGDGEGEKKSERAMCVYVSACLSV